MLNISCYINHRLVIATKDQDIERLKDEECAQEYAVEISNRFGAFYTLEEAVVI